MAANAAGYSLFGPPRTRIIINYGGKKLDFFSTKGTLSDALEERGITLFPQDKTTLALNEKLTGKAVKGAIDRSLPITIFDGYLKLQGRSTATDPYVILADNHIKIWPEDKISTDLILDPVTTGAAGIAVRIERAPIYYVSIDGKTLEVRSWDPGVSKIISLSKANVNTPDEVSPARGESLLPGNTIVITRVNEVDIPISSEIAFETKNTTSNAVPFGKSQVIQAGINGTLQKTYHVVYKNGIEVSRWLVSSAITKAVQHKVVARGSISGRANFGYYSGMVTSFYQGYKGHHLLVTNLQNGKQVTVEIIGSGPYNGPLMDMGTEPFKAIGGALSSGYLPSVSVVLLD